MTVILKAFALQIPMSLTEIIMLNYWFMQEKAV